MSASTADDAACQAFPEMHEQSTLQLSRRGDKVARVYIAPDFLTKCFEDVHHDWL